MWHTHTCERVSRITHEQERCGRTSFMEVLKQGVSSVPSSRALSALAKNHAARSTELLPGSETKLEPPFLWIFDW